MGDGQPEEGIEIAVGFGFEHLVLPVGQRHVVRQTHFVADVAEMAAVDPDAVCARRAVFQAACAAVARGVVKTLQAASFDVAVQREAAGGRFADGHHHGTVFTGRWDHDVAALAGGQGYGMDGAGGADVLVVVVAQHIGQLHQLVQRQFGVFYALDAEAAFDKHFVGTVNHDFGQAVAGKLVVNAEFVEKIQCGGVGADMGSFVHVIPIRKRQPERFQAALK